MWGSIEGPGVSGGALLQGDGSVQGQRYWEPHITTCNFSVDTRREAPTYHVCITSGYVTFGRAPRVLAILTRPLHSQSTKHTEGANQPGCNETKT